MGLLHWFLAVHSLQCVCSTNITVYDHIFKEETYLNSECLMKLVQFFPPSQTITLYNVHNSYNFVKTLSTQHRYSVVIKTHRACDHTHNSRNFVVIAKKKKNLDKIISCLRRNPFWRPSSRFIIIMAKSNATVLNKTLDILFKHYMFNSIVIQQSGDDAKIYTFDPYTKGFCGRSFGEIIDLGPCSLANSKSREYYFPENPRHDIRNCTITVAANQDIPNFIFESKKYEYYDGDPIAGLEQFIIETVAKAEQLTVKYILLGSNESYGGILTNGTYTGVFKYLRTDEADVAAGGMSLIKNRVDAFDFVWGYYYGTYNLYTKTSDDRKWRHVYKEFGTTTWIFIALTFITIVFMSFFVSKIGWKIGTKSYDRLYLIVTLWGYFFANTSKTLNQRKLYRRVLICWIFFTFFISSFYSTALYSLTTARLIPNEVKDMNYVTKNGYKFCCSKQTREYVLFAFNQKLPKSDCITEHDDPAKSFRKVSQNSLLYTIEMDNTYRLNECDFFDRAGRPRLQYVEYASHAVTAIYFHRGSILRSKFSYRTRLMFDSGLMEKQLRDITSRGNFSCKAKSKHYNRICLKDWWLSFFILFLGCLLSVLTFALEIFIRNHLDSEHRRQTFVPEFQSPFATVTAITANQNT